MRGGVALAFCCFATGLMAAPAVLFRSAPGQFEIAAVDADAARPVLAAAQTLWPAARGSLGLPAEFSTAVFVRIAPPETWREAAPFRVEVEPPGLVTLRLRGGAVDAEGLWRGLVQALVMREAVALHGVRPTLTAPLWLEFAVAEWARLAENPARLDRWKRVAAHERPPTLAALLSWQRGDAEPEAQRAGAFWLLAWLRSEAGRGGAWDAFLGQVLGGRDAGAALAECYGGDLADVRTRELWWLTGWHDQRRTPALPLLGAAESRAAIADVVRLVVARDGEETVLAPGDWRELGRSGFGRGELRRREAQLAAKAAAWHPFYRNAGLSLARLCAVATGGSAENFAAARAEFERDWRDATELEAASAQALDELEKR